MKIIPAIDIQDGRVVRLLQGDFAQKRVYSDSPVKIAQEWEKQGAKRLHLINLDGARTGRNSIIEIVRLVINSVSIPIQYGGGIRDVEMINKLIKNGISKVILGTVALENQTLLKKILNFYRDKIIVSLDAKGKKLLKKGWQETTDKDLISTAIYLQKIGVKTIIYTDTQKDGTLTQPNFAMIKALRKAINTSLFIAGGISSQIHIEKLEQIGIDGVIIGKALYENKIKL